MRLGRRGEEWGRRDREEGWERWGEGGRVREERCGVVRKERWGSSVEGRRMSYEGGELRGWRRWGEGEEGEGWWILLPLLVALIAMIYTVDSVAKHYLIETKGKQNTINLPIKFFKNLLVITFCMTLLLFIFQCTRYHDPKASLGLSIFWVTHRKYPRYCTTRI